MNASRKTPHCLPVLRLPFNDCKHRLWRGKKEYYWRELGWRREGGRRKENRVGERKFTGGGKLKKNINGITAKKTGGKEAPESWIFHLLSFFSILLISLIQTKNRTLRLSFSIEKSKRRSTKGDFTVAKGRKWRLRLRTRLDGKSRKEGAKKRRLHCCQLAILIIVAFRRSYFRPLLFASIINQLESSIRVQGIHATFQKLLCSSFHRNTS